MRVRIEFIYVEIGPKRKPSPGYINTKDKFEKKVIVPDPQKAPVVKMLFEKYVTGKYSFPELAVVANKLGQKSRHGLKVSKQLVSKIIRNPIYCGKIVVPKFEISTQGRHEPIISEKLFDEANSENKGVAGRRQTRNKDSPDFPLRGVGCASCGGNITGGRTKGKTKWYQYYNCIKSTCKEKKAIKKEDLENDFTKFLMELTPNDDFFDALKEAIKLAHKVELNSVEASERKLSVKIAELKNKKDKLLDLRIESKISNKDFIPFKEKLEVEIGELEKELCSLSTPELLVDSVVDSSVEFLKHLPKNWKTLDPKDLRVLRTLLFPKNVFYHYPDIKTPELCPIYNVKSQFCDEKNRFVMYCFPLL